MYLMDMSTPVALRLPVKSFVSLKEIGMVRREGATLCSGEPSAGNPPP
jgi:hypothetical protein